MIFLIGSAAPLSFAHIFIGLFGFLVVFTLWVLYEITPFILRNSFALLKYLSFLPIKIVKTLKRNQQIIDQLKAENPNATYQDFKRAMQAHGLDTL